MRAPFLYKKMCRNPYLIVCLTNSVSNKANLDQLITIKPSNLDQLLTPQHAYIYIYVWICMCIYVYDVDWNYVLSARTPSRVDLALFFEVSAYKVWYGDAYVTSLVGVVSLLCHQHLVIRGFGCLSKQLGVYSNPSFPLLLFPWSNTWREEQWCPQCDRMSRACCSVRVLRAPLACVRLLRACVRAWVCGWIQDFQSSPLRPLRCFGRCVDRQATLW